MNERIHTMPINDLREHVSSIHCWCRPRPNPEEPRHIIHNSMDRREEYERGERKPS